MQSSEQSGGQQGCCPGGSVAVSAGPAKDPTVRYSIIALGMIAIGIWCAYEILTGKYVYEPSQINKIGPWLANAAGMVLLPLGGLAMLVYIMLVLRRKAEAGEEGIGWRGKGRIAWSRFTRIDAQKLRDKGILDLYYDQDKKLTLDSWKLENFKQLVAFVETHLPADVKRTI